MILSYLPLPVGGLLGPDGRAGDRPLPYGAGVLVRHWQLYFPIQLSFYSLRYPLPSLWNHPFLLHLSADTSGQLLYTTHPRQARRCFGPHGFIRILRINAFFFFFFFILILLLICDPSSIALCSACVIPKKRGKTWTKRRRKYVKERLRRPTTQVKNNSLKVLTEDPFT